MSTSPALGHGESHTLPLPAVCNQQVGPADERMNCTAADLSYPRVDGYMLTDGEDAIRDQR